MTESKNLSNSFSTGGGGAHFEAHVQASFVTLMLTNGHAPCLPCWPIIKIKLQGKVDGYDTDDLIVFVENEDSKERRKLLCQVKHSIAITRGSLLLGEVMQAAWNDYNNPQAFSRNEDGIALITGPLSATDVHNTQWLLSQARCTKNAEEFFRNVEVANFSPPKASEKLNAIQYHLKIANSGSNVSRDEFYDFLKHFNLLGYDLGNESGVVLSLLHSHISQYHQQYPNLVWSKIVDFVQTWNQNAGTITLNNIPEDILDAFNQKQRIKIPTELKFEQAESKTDWTQHPDAAYLAMATLIGAWKDGSQSDIEVITELLRINYDAWLDKAREILQYPDSPLSLKNGFWKVSNRVDLLNLLGTRILDHDLEIFRTQAIAVLAERNPAFELSSEQRYMANVFGKVLTHSHVLRKGIAEGVAILANNIDSCGNCSTGRGEATCVLVVRELLANADWVSWGSLNDLLPTLAEAAPHEFLDAVEKVLQRTPSPFDELFSQESNGITGRNYLTGLLWALEGLAWDEQYFVRACVALADIASHDPGGQSGNRPSESLRTILLPWFPQTLAPIDKRKTAVKTLINESPEMAWNLLIQLLPNGHQASWGTYKPKWRQSIPDDWKSNVTNQEYWDQSSYYAELAIKIAGQDVVRLSALIDRFDDLPNPAFEQLLQILSSEQILTLPEEQRFAIWNHLIAFVKRHRKFPDAKWALSNGQISAIELVSGKFIPADPFYLHQNLFPADSFEFYDETTDWEERERKLDAMRDAGITEIFQKNGIENVIRFTESVSAPSQVGYALGAIDDSGIESTILPHFFDSPNSKHKAFLNGFIGRRYRIKGWEWCDGIDKSVWEASQIGQFLACLPFSQATWERASKWLHEHENEYWSRIDTNVYFVEGDSATAIEKFIEHGRPHAAIIRLDMMRYSKQSIEPSQCIQALLAAVSSNEPSYAISTHHIVELIKFLQNEPSVNQDDLLKIECAYVFLLDGHHDATPKVLENRLANDPKFFCEIIRFVFRSTNEEHSSQEPTEESRERATNAWRILNSWKVPPGTQKDGTFREEGFKEWLKAVKLSCAESGHLDVALRHVGEVLIYSPTDPEGLWIHRTVATALNERDADEMRVGFGRGEYNSRGVHTVDPTAAWEKAHAEKFRRRAEDVENAGFQRFAAALKVLANDYDREAEQVIAEHSSENE